MKVYFLFKLKNEEYICSYIYSEEHAKVFSYSFDEDYIVKTEEPTYKKLEDVETLLSKNSKSKKAKSNNPVLEKKDFADIKQALFFLDGTHDDFKEGIHARKKLPQIITPYEMDFEEDDEMKDEDLEDGVDEDKMFEDFKGFDEDEEDDLQNFDDDDDDLYR